MYCENCGAKVIEESKFCPKCGHKFEDVINRCPNCGETTENSENFCENCGSNLNMPVVVKKENILKKHKIPIIVGVVTVAIVLIIKVATLSFTAKPVDVGTQTVSVGTNRFVIPGDYRVDPSTIDVDYTGYNVVFSQGYANGEELIYISVMNIPYRVNGEDVVASQGGVQKHLMGVDGYYTEDGDGHYSFAFVDGAYINVVTVSSPYVFDQITYRG